jgi:uncharacterized protein YpuA (DUF1002 family)
MADNPKVDGAKLDFLAPFQQMRDAYLDVWAKTMVETVNSEAYAKATGGMLDAYLTVSAPFREAVEKAMLQALQQLSMPSRTDVITLAERMTNIELRLDDIDAKLDQIVGAQISRPATVNRRAAAPQARGRKRTK